MSIASEIARLQQAKTDIGEAIVAKGGEVSGTIDTYASAITALQTGGIASPIRSNGSHTDANGVWHRPDEWYDIENYTPPPYDTSVIFLLYDCTITKTPFVSLQVAAKKAPKVYLYSAVATDGDKTNRKLSLIETKTLATTGGTYRKYIGAYEQVVVKISGDNINSVKTTSWSATTDLNCAMPGTNQPCVMRYGIAKYFNNPAFSCYFLESDNLIGLGSLCDSTYSGETWASAYYNNLNLQRIRFTNWDLSHLAVTSFYNFLATCPVLSDGGNEIDMTGWVVQGCTSLTSMFSGCTSLRAKLVCSNWNFNSVTSASNVFYNCILVPEISGTSTWMNGGALTTCSQMFYGCNSLKGEVDLSGMHLGSGGKLVTMNGIFYGCYALDKINISNTDFSKATNISGMFYSTHSLKELVTENIVNISSACMNVNQLFAYSGLPEIVINGVDFSGVTSYNYYGLVAYSFAKKAVITNCLLPSTFPDTNATYSTVSRYSHQMKYLDASSFDLSRSTGTQISLIGFRNMECLVDFYPPQNIKTSFYISDSQNLSHDSIVRIIDNLSTVTTTQKLTLGAYNLAKLSADEKAIATNKGWTLA